MDFKRVLSTVAVCGSYLLVLAGTGWGQVQREEPVRFRVSTNLILVDARVLDSKGQAIQGLTKDDFKLSEDGQEQKISYFREVSIPMERRSPVVTARSKAVDTPPPPATASSSPEIDKRLLVMLFNTSSASLQDRQSMREAADGFIDRQMTDQDAVAVLVLDGGLELLTDLTSDPVAIRAALSRLSRITDETEASLPDEDEESEDESEFLADETELALFQTNQQLAAIQSVADAFRDVAGRKALLYFSPGLTNRGVETVDQMRVATDVCNRANMSIYAVDSRGLVALSPGGGAQRAGGGGRSIFNGRASLNQLAGLQQSQEGLFTLAGDTGGQALVDENDLSRIFRRAQEDSSHYYLLGYETPKAAADGKFRKIEVTATALGSRVISRRGYYSDRPYRQLSSAEKEFQLLQAVADRQPQADFPVLGGAEYFPVEDGYEVAVLASLEHSLLAKGGDESGLDLELILVARAKGRQASDALRDRVSIRRREIESDPTYVYENLLFLESGEYDLSIYVRNNQTGQMGSCDLQVKLPPLNSLLPTSSLILAGGWKETDTTENYRIKRGKVVTIVSNPLEVAGRVLLPRVDSIFHPGEELYLHLKVPGGNPVQYRIRIDSSVESILQSEWKSSRGAGDWQEVNARIPLNSLAAGSYTVSVDLREGEQTRQISRPFQISSDN